MSVRLNSIFLNRLTRAFLLFRFFVRRLACGLLAWIPAGAKVGGMRIPHVGLGASVQVHHGNGVVCCGPQQQTRQLCKLAYTMKFQLVHNPAKTKLIGS